MTLARHREEPNNIPLAPWCQVPHPLALKESATFYLKQGAGHKERARAFTINIEYQNLFSKAAKPFARHFPGHVSNCYKALFGSVFPR
jgi:hypothetical protein